jgi:hypothetical protein
MARPRTAVPTFFMNAMVGCFFVYAVGAACSSLHAVSCALCVHRRSVNQRYFGGRLANNVVATWDVLQGCKQKQDEDRATSNDYYGDCQTTYSLFI